MNYSGVDSKKIYLDTKLNTACDVSLKSVADFQTDKTPINIPLSLKLGKVMNVSVWIPAIALAKLL